MTNFYHGCRPANTVITYPYLDSDGKAHTANTSHDCLYILDESEWSSKNPSQGGLGEFRMLAVYLQALLDLAIVHRPGLNPAERTIEADGAIPLTYG